MQESGFGDAVATGLRNTKCENGVQIWNLDIYSAALLSLSAWMIRLYQQLLRVLNRRNTWKMQTKMQLHRQDSVAPGRYIYTLEHIHTDLNKCGRCIRCFNPFRKAGCQSMNKQYSQGVLVYEFAEDPDVAYSSELDA